MPSNERETAEDILSDAPSDFFDKAIESLYETDPEDYWVAYDDKSEDNEFISENDKF